MINFALYSGVGRSVDSAYCAGEKWRVLSTLNGMPRTKHPQENSFTGREKVSSRNAARKKQKSKTPPTSHHSPLPITFLRSSSCLRRQSRHNEAALHSVTSQSSRGGFSSECRRGLKTATTTHTHSPRPLLRRERKRERERKSGGRGRLDKDRRCHRCLHRSSPDRDAVERRHDNRPRVYAGWQAKEHE